MRIAIVLLALAGTAHAHGRVHDEAVVHDVHVTGDARLDGYYLGDELVYVDETRTIHDADGNLLIEVDGNWYAADCHWSAKRKRAAHAGDVTTAHALQLNHADETCGDPHPVGEAREHAIEAVLAAELVY